MLKIERMSSSEVYNSTKLVSVINPITPSIIKQTIQKHQKKLNCRYEELTFVLLVNHKHLDSIITSSEFDDFLDPATKNDVINHQYLGTLAFPLDRFSEVEIYCHLYYTDKDEITVPYLRVKEDLPPKKFIDVLNKLKEMEPTDPFPGRNIQKQLNDSSVI